ncbi:winged helix-turn-helix transcriptional regulator [Tsuneonella sp. HG249]
MEMIGERWTLLIVRELMLGARRFSDLRVSLPGISAKTLTERLLALEESRIVKRRELPPPGKAQVYELTEWGYAAEPLIQEAGRWAAQSSAHDPTLPLSPVSLMMSLRTMVPHQRLPQFARRTFGFAIGEDEFVAEPTARELPIRRGSVRLAEAVMRAPDASVIAGGIYAGVPWTDLERDAGLTIEGNRELALRFASIFKLPAKLT